MSEISKQALKVDNSQSFPDNNSGQITPSDLRAFNVNIIDSLVDEITYNVDSASWNQQINALESFTASQQPSFAALNQFTASQIVTNTNLNQFTQSATQELDSLSAWTGSWEAWTSSINEIRDDGVLQGYSTRFFFNGLVSASIVTNVGGPIANVTIQQDGTKLNTASFNEYTASTAATQSLFSASVATSISQSSANFTSFSASQNQFNVSISSSVQELLDLSSSLSGGYATQGELDYSASVLQGNIDALDTKFVNYTASQALLNTTFATTASNVFTGDQTLIDAAGNTVTLSDVSGSLMLVAKGFTSASAHISASTSNQVNLIFKNNNNTADTIISGSNNIFTNPLTPTTGFKRYIGGNNNYYNAAVIPQISGSMQFSPSMNRNMGGLSVTLRGPVSSSTYTLNDNISLSTIINLGTGAGTSSFEKMVSGYSFNQNAIFGGLISTTAGRTQLDEAANFNTNLIFGANVFINHNSSSANYNSNVQNGGITINNNYISASGATSTFKSTHTNINTIYGVSHAMTYAGSNASTSRFRAAIANLFAGTYVTASLQETGDNSSMLATNIMGNGLIVSGTSLSPASIASPISDATYGSTFTGRFNAIDGNKAKTAQTVFAVGTGTSYANRKTGFLVDSGSNTFVEGTLNVSGSLSFTGSVYGNVSASIISAATTSIDLSVANYFTLTLSGSTNINVLNPRAGVTATLVINTDTGASASFSANVKQPSGSFYAASPSGNIDIISFTAVDSTTVYAFPAQTFR